MSSLLSPTFQGFRRSRRKPGIRNLPVVFPLASSLNRLVETASQGTGVLAVQVHDALDSALSEFSLNIVTGFLANPNSGHVVLVSSGDSNDVSEDISSRLRSVDVPVSTFKLREASTIASFVQQLHEHCVDVADQCGRAERSTFPIGELLIGTECGGSDGYSGLSANPVVGRAMDWLISNGGTALLCELPEAIGAEHLLEERSGDPETARRVRDAVLSWEKLAARYGEDLRGAQPSPGNQVGGLTTIEEKSLGAIAKGGTTPVVELVSYGQSPSRQGLVIMDTPGHDVEQLTGMAAAGAQLVLFTTGRGTPTGCPVAPTLKIATNGVVAGNLASLIDFDASTVLSGRSLDEVADELWSAVIATANGATTASERAGQSDFAMPPLSACRLRLELPL